MPYLQIVAMRDGTTDIEICRLDLAGQDWRGATLTGAVDLDPGEWTITLQLVTEQPMYSHMSYLQIIRGQIVEEPGCISPKGLPE
jgi:hypothetical protein